MSRTKISEWSATAASNTDINGININEGCPPSTLNNMGRELMAQVKSWQDGSSGDSATNSGTLTSSGTLAITGAMTLDAAAGTAGQVLTSAGSGTPTWTTLTTFVSGMIMLWSGSEASIPAGWLLCDGTSSTPNLQDRFVVGAGDTYAVAATGGSADAVVVSHTHTATSTVTDPGHFHNLTNSGGGGSSGGSNISIDTNIGGTITTASKATGITVATTNATTGVSGTNANLPPYYALAYIMKS